TLKRLNPDISAIEADLGRPGDWQQAFAGIDTVFQLQAQISATDPQAFADNTVRSTEAVLAACRQHGVRYLIHVSSSVVNSAADDDYVRSKTAQERLVADSGLAHVILRPTLMFGWFDRKHLGWLSRFMARVPVFPVVGHGRYLRQPLYVRDFCRILIRCLEMRPQQQVFDITGQESIDYI